MNILAFDTSFFTCAVGLSHDGQVTVVNQFAPMQQSKLLLPTISALLQQQGLTPDQLDAIVYGSGPGSFTGMRISQSVAQGIGFAVQIPLYPISSLAILAQSAWMTHGWEKVVICLDARMGKIHWAEYVLHNHIMTLQGEERVLLASEMPVGEKHDWHGIGDGWKTYLEALTVATNIPSNAVDSACEPRAEAILTLAHEKNVNLSHNLRS